MIQIPKRLGKEPLIEAIWQLEFEPEANQSVGDLLPGVMFSTLRKQHPGLKLHRLPNADIPPQIAQNDPNLRNAPKHRMSDEDSPFLYQVGDRVITVNCRIPYVGWSAFKDKILQVIDVVQGSGFVPNPQRHALRFIDLLTLDAPPDLTSLRLKLDVGDFSIQRTPLQMRLELQEKDTVHIVQIVTPAQVTIPTKTQDGTIVDIETYEKLPPQSWEVVKEQLDKLHERSKLMFFGNILTKEAIDRMEPEYWK